MKMFAAAMAVAAMVALGARPAGAHAGHAHKVMGTVTMIAADHVMVKTKEKGATEEKVVTILVNDKTKVLKGTAAGAMTDVTAGQRVVIDVGDGSTPVTAKSITVAAAKAKTAGTN
jgi:hypothetical protein